MKRIWLSLSQLPLDWLQPPDRINLDNLRNVQITLPLFLWEEDLDGPVVRGRRNHGSSCVDWQIVDKFLVTAPWSILPIIQRPPYFSFFMWFSFCGLQRCSPFSIFSILSHILPDNSHARRSRAGFFLRGLEPFRERRSRFCSVKSENQKATRMAPFVTSLSQQNKY